MEAMIFISAILGKKLQLLGTEIQVLNSVLTSCGCSHQKFSHRFPSLTLPSIAVSSLQQ